MKRPYSGIPVILIYVLFVFGGLWHYLGLFQPLMRLLASPILITVSVWLGADVLRNGAEPADKKRFLFWALFVVAAGWSVEYMGVRTGYPFGSYQYGPVLNPRMAGIPVAIGFSWFTVCLSSLIMARWIALHFFVPSLKTRALYQALITSVLMVLFDMVMEQAAPELEYWTWKNNRVPVANYLAWFGIAFIFAKFWSILHIRLNRLPPFAFHAYVAQLVYFFWVILI
ncbi:carotenoid biosynthesis protein [bacterium]|nr:carotenoid biosynthesis protein [bacterium]